MPVLAFPALQASSDGPVPDGAARRGGGADHAQQGGLERVAATGLVDDAELVANEAIALVHER